MKLLIIGDDAVDWMTAIRSLKNAGLSVADIVQTTSVNECVQLARSAQFDIILVNYQLSPSNGFDVLRMLRRMDNLSSAIVML